ncbi:MAG: M28 family peptidase, partial [Candidatus Aenigmarchaeota archaeon]|nr:M28 family peptidase [Candidatus Aenigmarchaeota archaeon]
DRSLLSPSKQIPLIALLTTLVLIGAIPCRETALIDSYPLEFSGSNAFSYLEEYMELSPIIPGSQASLQFHAYVTHHLKKFSWEVELQNWMHQGTNQTLHNLIAKKHASDSISKEILILGAHYDTRLLADRDPDPSNHQSPVPGANDGGSGVVVLLELARVLDFSQDLEIWLVFFDAEDQGGIRGWDGGIQGWCIGSTYFVGQLSPLEQQRILVAIIIDLVGDFNLILKKERNSDPTYVQEIWQAAAKLGYSDCFVDDIGSSIIDDHIPFLEAGIPAVDIIQQKSRDGYPFFQWHHTINDTIENVSSESLEKVGRTLEYYIEHDLSHVSSIPTTQTASETETQLPSFPRESLTLLTLSVIMI